MPDSLCFPFFTQAINEILSTSPCHCLVGFPLHPAIASFPLCAPASTAHSLYALAFLLRFVWFATARNDIAPSRLYSVLSSLISFPICVHARKVRRETFPALFAHSLSRLHCWHTTFTSITLYRLSPAHLLLLSVQHDSMFIPICLSSAGCLRGLAPSVMLWSSPCLRTQCSCAFAHLCRSLPALSRKYICLLSHTAVFASFLLCKGSQARALQVPFILHYSRTFFKIFWDKPQNICFALSVKYVLNSLHLRTFHFRLSYCT